MRFATAPSPSAGNSRAKRARLLHGQLFAERLEFAEFNPEMRNGLLACCRFHWKTISPAGTGRQPPLFAQQEKSSNEEALIAIVYGGGIIGASPTYYQARKLLTKGQG
jgi:hypothetical protein